MNMNVLSHKQFYLIALLATFTMHKIFKTVSSYHLVLEKSRKKLPINYFGRLKKAVYAGTYTILFADFTVSI